MAGPILPYSHVVQRVGAISLDIPKTDGGDRYVKASANRPWSTENLKIIRVDAQSADVHEIGLLGDALRDPMDAIGVRVAAAERETVLAGVALGDEPVATVPLKDLELRQHHDLPGVAVDDTDDLLPGVDDQTVEQRREQRGRRRIKEEPRCVQVLLDIGFDDVSVGRLDFDGRDVLVHDLLARPALAGAFPALDQGHDHVVLELSPMVVGTRVIRFLNFVTGSDVKLVTRPHAGAVKNFGKVGRERPENELFKNLFLRVHSILLNWLYSRELRLKGKVPSLPREPGLPESDRRQ